ncbi:MAG: hypothetical protein Q9195_002692 [Heterodermia aff. obscurata]
MKTEEDMANLQRLSNDYVPEAQVHHPFDWVRELSDTFEQGDLVGHLQSTQAITAEYAQADPVYVHKTTNLQALAYGYFEALSRTGDPERIQSEMIRLKSLNNLLNTMGHDPTIYEDFVDETFTLLERTRTEVPSLDGGAMLLSSFNDPNIAAPIITHFRLITSSWMRRNAQHYQNFLLDSTVDQYCRSRIDPHLVEIENIGIQALVDAVIKPAGITLEVTYLDRSIAANGEANTITWQGEMDYPTTPTIRLLYRPGHYDILYKIGDIPDMNRQVHLLSYHQPFGSANLLFHHPGLGLEHFDIPGLSSSGISSSGISSTGIPTPFTDEIYSPSFTSPSLQLPQAPPDQYSVPAYPPAQSPLVQSRTIQSPTVKSTPPDSFRKSKFQLEPEYQHLRTAPQEPCQTDAMLSAGADTSHFMNENFQPQIWEPGAEYKNGRETTSQNTEWFLEKADVEGSRSDARLPALPPEIHETADSRLTYSIQSHTNDNMNYPNSRFFATSDRSWICMNNDGTKSGLGEEYTWAGF